MEILNLTTKEINQNGYHKTILTRDKIGALFIFPNGHVPEDCLACDGYALKIEDYQKLYAIIGKDYNNGSELEDEFRIPDYNLTGLFLQPGAKNFGTKKAAGLPKINLALRVDASGKVNSYYGNKSLSAYGTDDYGLLVHIPWHRCAGFYLDSYSHRRLWQLGEHFEVCADSLCD